MVPSDPETRTAYRYERTSASSFNLCAVFSAESPDTAGQGEFMGRDIAYPSWGGGLDESWKHPVGEHCFSRTIDPERYPLFEKPTF